MVDGRVNGMSNDRWDSIRPAAFVVTALAAAAILGYGIFREEIGEVLFNAAML